MQLIEKAGYVWASEDFVYVNLRQSKISNRREQWTYCTFTSEYLALFGQRELVAQALLVSSHASQ